MRVLLVGALLAAAAVAASGAPSGAADVPAHDVRGSVTVEAGGLDVDIYLELTDAEGDNWGEAVLGPDGGSFVMPEVEDGGPYTLTMIPDSDFDLDWRTQYYPDTYFESEAAPITIAGADVDLDPMTLHLMHDVKGSVVAGVDPVLGMRITAYPAGPGVTTYNHGLSTTTDDEDGTYDLWLPPGTWKVRYSGVSDDWIDDDLITTWAPMWFPAAASFAEATPVVVPAVTDLGTTTLTDGGSISGTVTDSATGLGVRDLDVQVIDADNGSAAPS